MEDEGETEQENDEDEEETEEDEEDEDEEETKEENEYEGETDEGDEDEEETEDEGETEEEKDEEEDEDEERINKKEEKMGARHGRWRRHSTHSSPASRQHRRAPSSNDALVSRRSLSSSRSSRGSSAQPVRGRGHGRDRNNAPRSNR
ncbi:hypothetical protein CRE_31316 [Caenorhabditis remanei]|uniref:Uncharacterized protein n=1 Tax=Caenorhabditis remanei TaxID=31234 RepID=E3MLT8_CAERE|nr:hypothetical protein CRE_31316 [Caenorhabditis remanei]